MVEDAKMDGVRKKPTNKRNCNSNSQDILGSKNILDPLKESSNGCSNNWNPCIYIIRKE